MQTYTHPLPTMQYIWPPRVWDKKLCDHKGVFNKYISLKRVPVQGKETLIVLYESYNFKYCQDIISLFIFDQSKQIKS